MTVKKFKKMSEENQPQPQTIIKGCLSIPLRTGQKQQLKQRVFGPSLVDDALVNLKQPRINH